MALRETVGYTREDLAQACLATVDEVRAWEAGLAEADDLAWETVADALEAQGEMLATMREHLAGAGRVVLGYLADDAEAREAGLDVPARVYNASVRSIAAALRAEGVEVGFAYPSASGEA